MEALANKLSSPLGFIVALGLVIFVHEAGHLLIAKAFGVRVLTFSLGFGKRLWGFRRGETEYRVSLVPLGGYVKMSGELPGEGGDDPADFLNKARWQRFLVYLAGPAMNVVLSVSLVAMLFMWGIHVPATQDTPA
ncbi:MAG: site-2 protease family protein, partial [Acidobacteria bacterium]|nr:site-2 protease family protein [Acidobacteriota bacterium]